MAGSFIPKEEPEKNGGICPTFHSRIRVELLPNNRTKRAKNHVVFYWTY